MNIEDIKTLKKLETPDFSAGNSETPITKNNDSLETIGKEKIESLKKTITELKELIKEREGLSKNIYQECEKLKTEIENFLISTTAVDSEDFKERTGLRHKKIELAELQLNENVNCWQDIALLKKELREREKELNNKEARIDMLSEILE